MGFQPMIAVHRDLAGTPDKKQERRDLSSRDSVPLHPSGH
jgi:hypothetical protein